MEYKVGDIYVEVTPQVELTYYVRLTSLWYRNGDMSSEFPVSDRDISASFKYYTNCQLIRDGEVIVGRAAVDIR